MNIANFDLTLVPFAMERAIALLLSSPFLRRNYWLQIFKWNAYLKGINTQNSSDKAKVLISMSTYIFIYIAVRFSKQIYPIANSILLNISFQAGLHCRPKHKQLPVSTLKSAFCLDQNTKTCWLTNALHWQKMHSKHGFVSLLVLTEIIN